MVLFSYQRLAHLFNTIKSEVLPQSELARRFLVSSRTIRNDINTLNEILAVYGARIAYDRATGYQLHIDDEEKFAKLPDTRPQIKTIPRTAKERVQALILKFLLASSDSESIKLDDIADEWFISRSALQQDMLEVKEHLNKSPLKLEKKSRYGIRVVGAESAIRSSITDIFWQMYLAKDERTMDMFKQKLLITSDLALLEKILQNSLDRFDIRLTNEAHQYLLFNCAISMVRITSGHEIVEFVAHDINDRVKKASQAIVKGLVFFLGAELTEAEEAYLQVQIAARHITDAEQSSKGEISRAELTEYILNYVNDSYNYDLRSDEKLINDLSNHLSAMLVRVKYQINSSNPLLDDIKKYYPFAYDVTLSAMTSVEKHLRYNLTVTEDELGYLAVHIGVGLERNYNLGYERLPHVLIVNDSGNSTLRVLEAKILRQYPQIKVNNVISLRDYEVLEHIEEDFVITTARITEKDKPIVKVAPFPTPYQLEQIGRLAMIDRTKPYILERFFDEKYFMIVNESITQETLFEQVCKKLHKDGYVAEEFYASLVEREAIVSTLLDENIALPHSLGLLAKKTIVMTILAPNGIQWGSAKDEVANVIFLLAICKDEYEEAMAIYDLFVTFVKEKATKRLLNSKNFSDFQSIAKDSLGRIA